MTAMTDPAALRDRVAELLTRYRIPSAAVGILHHGRVTGFATGVTDVRTGAPATVETVYQCGSMTKTWTALAFLRMADEGKVSLDEPVHTYLPAFRVADPSVSAALTPRHLLDHTNGIEESYGDAGEDEDVYARMVAAIADAPQVFPLGHTHGYSAALGYAILARIMEVTDRAPWHEILRRRVFEPLGQTATDCLPGAADAERAATGHILRSFDEGPIVSPIPYLPRAFGPGGAVSSTVRDVLSMAHIFLADGRAPDGNRMLSPHMLREMTDSRVPVPDPYMFGPEWALGLVICDWHGETVYATDGTTIGQNARLRILPGHDLAVVVLTNGGPRESFARKVFQAILPEFGAPAPPDLPVPDPLLRLDPGRYTGVYGRPGGHYEVTADGERLRLAYVTDAERSGLLGIPDRTEYDLLPVSETHFLLPARNALEDTQTLALYDFPEGRARYLHTNCRVNPRIADRVPG